jgi:hypothetical protein
VHQQNNIKCMSQVAPQAAPKDFASAVTEKERGGAGGDAAPAKATDVESSSEGGLPGAVDREEGTSEAWDRGIPALHVDG